MKRLTLALVLTWTIALPAATGIGAGNDRPNIVALTFDDGPNPVFLEKALPYFEKENIKVTFFIIGSTAKTHPDWVKRAASSGHEIENHTQNHICLAQPSPAWTGCPQISESRALSEVAACSSAIKSITGKSPLFLRPPNFAMNSEIKRAIEATGITVLSHDDRTSIGSMDWVYRNPDKIFKRTCSRISQTGNGPHVIVFHETLWTLQALPEIIAFLRERNYKIVTLEEFSKLCPKTKL